jgi:hypothetical protein
MRFTKISVLAVLAAGMFFASNASAAIVVGGADGWSFSTDGMVNLFGVYQTGDDLPTSGVNPGYSLSPAEEEGFRITNGFLPNILAFNIKAPTMKGLDTGARIGFYPSSSFGNDKNERFNGQIDLREVFFTVDGNFGQVMVGKGLGLFLGQNLLTEQTLMGVGRSGNVHNASLFGVTLGRISYGYLYPNFDAQFRYTTPDMGGTKLAVALFDPATVRGGGFEASKTTLPRVEAELSYAGVAGDTTIKSYINALWQEADGDVDVTSWGVGGGVVAGLGGFELSGSAFASEGLGTTAMFDLLDGGGDALDGAGKERKVYGYIGQLAYTFANEGKTKIGLSYGANRMSESSADRVDRANGSAFIKTMSMTTLMLTQDITTNLKLVAEASYLNHEWHNGSHMEVEMFSIGTFFLW